LGSPGPPSRRELIGRADDHQDRAGIGVESVLPRDQSLLFELFITPRRSASTSRLNPRQGAKRGLSWSTARDHTRLLHVAREWHDRGPDGGRRGGRTALAPGGNGFQLRRWVRLLGIVGAVAEQLGAEGRGPLVLVVEFRCRWHRQVQVQLLWDRTSGHVAFGSEATCWNATVKRARLARGRRCVSTAVPYLFRANRYRSAELSYATWCRRRPRRPAVTSWTPHVIDQPLGDPAGWTSANLRCPA
jgi:hypothetical protein